MADTTISTRILLRHDTAANWTSTDPVLKAGETGLETDTLRVKIGNGTSKWSELDYTDDAVYTAINAKGNYTEVVPNDGETDAQALARVITDPLKGDIAVVKRTITTGKYSYTGYVYGGSAWGAMDGNYSADNVYLSNDITLAGNYTQVGNITKSSATSTGTFAVAGKTVTEALTEIFSKRLQPANPTAPTANFKTYSGASNATVEPGTPVSGTISYELQLNSAGSYQYGPSPTGVTEDGVYSITYYDGTSTGLTKNTKSGTFTYSFTVGTSNKSVGISASSVGHTQGAIAKDNLGSDSNPVKRIAAGSKSAGTKTNTWTSSRKSFWNTDGITGTSLDQSTAEKKAQVSNMIRTLSSKEFGAKKTLDLTITEGTKRVILCVPGTVNWVTSGKGCEDVGGMGLDVKDTFTRTTGIKVGGYDATSTDIGSYEGDYTVFIKEVPAGLAATTYKIRLA